MKTIRMKKWHDKEGMDAQDIETLILFWQFFKD